MNRLGGGGTLRETSRSPEQRTELKAKLIETKEAKQKEMESLIDPNLSIEERATQLGNILIEKLDGIVNMYARQKIARPLCSTYLDEWVVLRKRGDSFWSNVNAEEKLSSSNREKLVSRLGE